MLEEGRPMVEFILSHMSLGEFTDGPTRRMVEVFLEMYQAGNVQPARIKDGAYGGDLQQLAAAVMVDEHEPSANWSRSDVAVPRLNQKPRESAISSMKLLKLDRVNEALRQVQQRIYQATQAGGSEDVPALQRKKMALQDLRQQIQRHEFLEWNVQPAG
jgi:DNA primase